jgi:hypothetical protein
MASGNRVEELESQVKELQATVDGLTDELVECKVRIRELENVVDAEVGLDNIGEKPESEVEVEAESASESREDPHAEVTESAEEADPADTTKSEAPEGGDNAESEDSDIIIA